MALRFFGKDPNTDEDECPTVWVDEKNADLVIQGWKADQETREECLTIGPIPDTEDIVRIPARMVELVRKACDDAEKRAAELQ